MIKKIQFISLMLCILMITSSCGISTQDKLLDPEKPITITVWNYYNGTVKVKFDELVSRFNETIGAEQGIVVEAQSYGDVNELADAVFESANEEIGAMQMPDIFASYPDNAFRVDQISELADLNEYFTKEELGEIREEFLSEGYFGEEGALKILPIAKSTEVLYLNKTYWDAFAGKTGADISNLSTWEGLAQTAKKYYEATGKPFFSLDANANFMLISAMQLGEEMYTYNEFDATLNLSEDTAYRIWKNYYVPFLNGYYAKSGRFSSDDARTGAIAAYTGSTAGASYFPGQVERDGDSTPIEVMALPYPHYEEGEAYVVQQGAGMCIARSDAAHEYAAAVFLKWFINVPQNIEFAAATGYLPVKTEALDVGAILNEMKEEDRANVTVTKTIKAAIDMLNSYTLYGNKPFRSSYEIRSILESSLFELVKHDLETLENRVNEGENRQAVIDELCGKEHFDSWYQEFTGSIQSALSRNR